MEFDYNSVPWPALSALSASTGRLFDELIRADKLSGSYLNLPFIVVATGVAIRGFLANFLQRSGVIPEFSVPEVQVDSLHVSASPLTAEERLAVFVVAGGLVSLLGARIASYFSGAMLDAPDLHE